MIETQYYDCEERMTEYIKRLRKFVGHSPVLQCGASVIIMDDMDRILLMHRTDNDCWCFPGGSVELGESVKETAIREAFEETGLFVSDLIIFDVFSGEELYYKYPNGDEVYNIDVVFVTRNYEGDIITENEESKDCKFFSITDLPQNISAPVIPVMKHFIKSWSEKSTQFTRVGK